MIFGGIWMKTRHKAWIFGAGTALLALGFPYAAMAKGISPSVLAITGSAPGQNITSNSASAQLKIEGASPEEKKQGIGPYVTSVSLSETRYEDYGLYSESINNEAFFYANVSNGGMTDQPVYMDFPKNVQYALEKDGVEQEYQNKSYLTESGSYVFHVYVVKDSAKPLSEQTISEATFNFRIQQKLPGAGQSTSGSASSAYDSYSSYSSNSQPYIGGVLGGDQNINNAISSVNDAVNAAGGMASDAGSAYQDLLEAQSGLLSGNLTGETAEASETESAAESEAAAEESGVPAEAEDQGSLQELLAINVPNGMLSNTAVSFDPDNVSAMGASVTVLRNGEDYDIPVNGSFNEVGSYTMLVRRKDSLKPEIYSFRLVGDTEADMGLYTVPEGLTVDSLSVNGEPQSLAGLTAASGAAQIDFSQEGSYELGMSSADGYTYSVTLRIDNTPPALSVSEKGNAAEISYLSKDVDHVLLYDESTGSATQYDGSSLTLIKDAGRYILQAYDSAGNVSAVSFRVRKGVNVAAIIAILFVIALGASAVFFVKRTRENTGVR